MFFCSVDEKKIIFVGKKHVTAINLFFVGGDGMFVVEQRSPLQRPQFFNECGINLKSKHGAWAVSFFTWILKIFYNVSNVNRHKNGFESKKQMERNKKKYPTPQIYCWLWILIGNSIWNENLCFSIVLASQFHIRNSRPG